MIKVLWIDDECLNEAGELSPAGREFVATARRKGIEVTAVAGYDEGLDLINRNPQEYIAVILDVKNPNDTVDNVADGYMEARDELERIQTRLNQQEPYIFVLSGDREYHDNSALFPKKAYQSKRIYDKNTKDYEILFEDIVKIENVSALYKCQREFEDVLKAVRELCGEDEYERVLLLTVQIMVYGHNDKSEYFNSLRKVLEAIMSLLERRGYYKDVMDRSLNNLSRYIGRDRRVPVYVQRSFHSLVEISQNGSHLLEVDDDTSENKAPYLLRSCLFELFNIIIWLRDYCKKI